MKRQDWLPASSGKESEGTNSNTQGRLQLGAGGGYLCVCFSKNGFPLGMKRVVLKAEGNYQPTW